MSIQTKNHKVKPLSMRAAVGSVDAKTRTAEVVFSTGAKVMRFSWLDGNYWEELDMSAKSVRLDRLNSGAPLLMDHNGYNVVNQPGVVESARLESGKGIAKVRFAAEGVDPAADMLFKKIQDGIVRSVSVGYRIHKVEKIQTEGEKIPTMRVVDWTPYEISVVAMPADAGAGFRSAENEAENDCEVITQRGESSTTEEQDEMKNKRKFQEPDSGNGGGGAPAAAVPPPAPVTAQITDEQRNAIALEERSRVNDIQHAVRTAKLEPSFAEKLVKEGVSADAARKLVLAEMAKRDAATPTESHVRVTGVEGQDEREKWVRGMSAAIFLTAGAAQPVRDAHSRAVAGHLRSSDFVREFKGLDLDGGHFRALGRRALRISDLARLSLDRRGVSTRGITDPEALVALAVRETSGDFAVLFENVMYKTLRASYAVQADTWREWMGTDQVADFRTANRFMNGAFSGALPVVPEDDEYENLEITDGSKLTIDTETRGGIISLSRRAIVNDDMGALVDIAARFGARGGKSIEIAAYELLAQNGGLGPTVNGNPFFHSSNANVGTSSVLSVAGIAADKLKMRQQTYGDDYIDQVPSILLVNPAKEDEAKVINASAIDHTTPLDQKPNSVQGLFSKIVSSPRLSASTTRRYMFTAAKEAFKVVFLEGSGEGPTMTSHEEFRRDGLSWKVRIDFKAQAFDPKTALTNAGT